MCLSCVKWKRETDKVNPKIKDMFSVFIKANEICIKYKL